MSDRMTRERRSDALESTIALDPIEIAVAWNVRGSATQASFAEEVQRSLGIKLPVVPNTSERGDGAALLWIGPRSWLYVPGAGTAPPEFEVVRNALNAAGGALFDVSASYVAWSVAGAAAPRVLSRGCPLDFHPRAFPSGHCAQSLLGHIGALFYRPDDAPRFVVFVARSFAKDARHHLEASIATEGQRAR